MSWYAAKKLITADIKAVIVAHQANAVIIYENSGIETPNSDTTYYELEIVPLSDTRLELGEGKQYTCRFAARVLIYQKLMKGTKEADEAADALKTGFIDSEDGGIFYEVPEKERAGMIKDRWVQPVSINGLYHYT